MSRLSFSEKKKIELDKLMRKLKIYKKDIKESFVRSSGPGGQNVNKVSTCVFLPENTFYEKRIINSFF